MLPLNVIARYLKPWYYQISVIVILVEIWTPGRAQVESSSSLEKAQSVGSQSSRKWWHCLAVRLSILLLLLEHAKLSGWHGCSLKSGIWKWASRCWGWTTSLPFHWSRIQCIMTGPSTLILDSTWSGSMHTQDRLRWSSSALKSSWGIFWLNHSARSSSWNFAPRSVFR